MDLSHLTLRPIADVSPDFYQNFECTRPELVEFLREDALGFSQMQLTQTYLVLDAGGSVLLGYFSLSSDAIRLTPSERVEIDAMEIELPVWPAVKITKLAIHQNFDGKGLGSRCLNLIVGLIANSGIAARFITVDAVNNPRVLNFYDKNGFVDSLQAEKERKSVAVKHTTLKFKDILA